jgi:anti-anti-sigma factor
VRPEDPAIAVRETGTTFTVVALGEWDLARREAVQDATRAVLERRPECVVLDLSQLSLVDTSGIRSVLELRDRCRQDNIHFVIIPGRRSVQRLFDIRGLTDSLPFVGSDR